MNSASVCCMVNPSVKAREKLAIIRGSSLGPYSRVSLVQPPDGAATRQLSGVDDSGSGSVRRDGGFSITLCLSETFKWQSSFLTRFRMFVSFYCDINFRLDDRNQVRRQNDFCYLKLLCDDFAYFSVGFVDDRRILFERLSFAFQESEDSSRFHWCVPFFGLIPSRLLETERFLSFHNRMPSAFLRSLGPWSVQKNGSENVIE